jgi:hypothetical protein
MDNATVTIIDSISTFGNAADKQYDLKQNP